MLLVVIQSGCFKDYNERHLFTKQMIEFEDAVTLNNAPGKNYPVLSPIYYQDSIKRFRVNFFGEPPSGEQTLNFKVVEDETTAVEGKDFEFPNGTSFRVKADSSYGYIDVQVLSDGSGTTLLVLELLGSSEVAPAKNYKTIGIPISFPSTPPNPANVHKINDIYYIDSIVTGSYKNNKIGSFLDLKTGIVYNNDASSSMYAKKIDLVYEYSGANAANFLTPFGPEIISFGGPLKSIVLGWSQTNEGEYIKYSGVSDAEEIQYFNAISSSGDIEAAWNTALTDVTSRPGYTSSANGPGRRIRSMEVGDLIFFHSLSRQFYAIIKILDVNPGSNGTLTMGVKVRGIN